MGKRDWAIFFLAIALTVLGVVRVFVEGSIETGAWGLSFRQEGSAPIGPAGVDQLRQYDAAYLGDTRQKRLYLTFDAGYENGSTEKILDTLKAHGVRAAFFLVGNYVDRNRDLVRRMVEEGHIVGNHTMHHYDMSKLSDKQAFSKELTDLEDLFREVTGKDLPKYYRPQPGEPENGQGAGLQNRLLESRLCGLDERQAANQRASLFQAPAQDPSWGGHPAALHLSDQCRNSR